MSVSAVFRGAGGAEQGSTQGCQSQTSQSTAAEFALGSLGCPDALASGGCLCHQRKAIGSKFQKQTETWIILPELVVSALKKEQSRVTGSRKVPSEVPTQTARKGFQKKSFQAGAESLPVGIGLTCSLYNLEAAVPGALGFRGDWPQLTTLAQEMVPCTPIRTGYR